MKILADPDNKTDVYVAYQFLSNRLLTNVLNEVNKFLRENPEEIVILKISNYQENEEYDRIPVSTSLLDQIISQNLDAKYILNRDNLGMPIGSYGGAYFTGGFVNSKYHSIVVKETLPLTKSATPSTLISSLHTYFASNHY